MAAAPILRSSRVNGTSARIARLMRGRMGRLSLKVVPGSSRDEIVGWLGDSLKVKRYATLKPYEDFSYVDHL